MPPGERGARPLTMASGAAGHREAPSAGLSETIMIVAGEASGDLHGAALAQALRMQAAGYRLVGMGGPAMTEAGVDCVVDVTAESPVGFVEALGHLGALRRAFHRLRAVLVGPTPPRLVVLIDFPEFNFRLARVARRSGIPVVYFIPPQIWAWRPGRVKTMRRLVSLVLAVLPFELALYQQAGVPVEFVGHPLRDRIAAAPSRETARERLGLDAGSEMIGLLPGSRPAEIKSVLPVMRTATQLIRQRRPGVRFVLALAPTVERHMANAVLGSGSGVAVVQRQTYAVMRAADLLLATSGTATLEAALLGTPMVVCYRLTALSEAIVRLLLRVPWVSLPNLLAGRAVVPELYRHATSPENLADLALDLLASREALAAQRAAFAEISDQLGAGNVAERAAALVLAAASRAR